MTRITGAIFSIYIATLLYTAIPFVKTLNIAGKNEVGLFWNHIAIFAIFFLLAFFVLGRYISAFSGHGKVFGATLALGGLILTVLYHVVPLAPVYKLPAVLAPYFATDIAYTAWLLAPLVILFF